MGDSVRFARFAPGTQRRAASGSTRRALVATLNPSNATVPVERVGACHRGSQSRVSGARGCGTPQHYVGAGAYTKGPPPPPPPAREQHKSPKL